MLVNNLIYQPSLFVGLAPSLITGKYGSTSVRRTRGDWEMRELIGAWHLYTSNRASRMDLYMGNSREKRDRSVFSSV